MRLALGAVLAVVLSVGVVGCGSGSSGGEAYIGIDEVELEIESQVQESIDSASNPFERQFTVGKVTCEERPEHHLECRAPLIHDENAYLNDDLYYDVTRNGDGSWSSAPQ